MKSKIIKAALILFAAFFINSCSCDGWFNNGCEFKETWLGEVLK